MIPSGRRFDYDDEDPFGSRPDEKPPEGWQAGFWDKVSRKIEEEKNDPDRGRLPRPSRNRVPVLTTLLLLAAALLLLQASASSSLSPLHEGDSLPVGVVTVEERSERPGDTVVHVDGSRVPDVAVEWARINGHQSGYVVLQSVAPDLSYVLIDQRLSMLPVDQQLIIPQIEGAPGVSPAAYSASVPGRED